MICGGQTQPILLMRTIMKTKQHRLIASAAIFVTCIGAATLAQSNEVPAETASEVEPVEANKEEPGKKQDASEVKPATPAPPAQAPAPVPAKPELGFRAGGIGNVIAAHETPVVTRYKDRIQSVDVLLIETKDGLSAYSMSLGKWDSVVVGLPKNGQSRLRHATLSERLACVVIDDQLFGFSSQAGRWGKPVKIPDEHVGKVKPILEGNLAFVKMGDKTFTLSLKTAEWTSPSTNLSFLGAQMLPVPLQMLGDTVIPVMPTNPGSAPPVTGTPVIGTPPPASADTPFAQTNRPEPTIEQLRTQAAEQKLQSTLDGPEARRLAAEIMIREKRSEELAYNIRSLKKAIGDDPKLSSKPLETYNEDLRITLSEAFDLKHQLEQLRVRELQSRLSRMEQQIGQRQSQRTQIIERRVGELIEGEGTRWNIDSDRDAPTVEAKVSFTEKFPVIPKAERGRSDVSRGRRPDGLGGVGPNAPRESEWTATGTSEPLFSTSHSSFKNLAINLEQARHELQAAKLEFSNYEMQLNTSLLKRNAITNHQLEVARTRMETAERKYRILQDDIATTLSDLELGLKFYDDELKGAKELFDATKAPFDVGSAGADIKSLKEAERQLRKTQLESQRLKAMYENYKKLRDTSQEQNADGKKISDQKTEPAADVIDPKTGDQRADGKHWPLMVPPGLPADQNSPTRIQQLGLHLKELPASERSSLGKTLNRGMTVFKVDPESAAADAGIHSGDILVGLDKWQTASIDNVIWILNHLEHPLNRRGDAPIRYLIVRNLEEREGHIRIGNSTDVKR